MGAEWFLFYLPPVLFVFAMAVWFTPGQYQLVKDDHRSKNPQYLLNKPIHKSRFF
jgi:hypothetical protein